MSGGALLASVRTADAASGVRAQGVEVAAVGECPSATQVSGALDYVFRGAENAADSGPKSAPAVPSAARIVLEVTDLGPVYRVSLAGQTRKYVDDARNCQERARAAAVFAAVTLEPPEVLDRTSAAPGSAPTGASPRPVRRPQFALAAGARLDVAPRSAGSTLGAGGEARAVLTWLHWGAEMGFGAIAPADIRFGAYAARISHVPIDTSLRATLYRSPGLELWAAAGLSLSVLMLEGNGSVAAARTGGSRLDVGARGAVSLRLWPDASVAPFVSLHSQFFPWPYSVVIDPGGPVGTTPGLWFGGTIGIQIPIP